MTAECQPRDEVDQHQEKQCTNVSEMSEIDLRRMDGMKLLILWPVEQLTKESTEKIWTIVQGLDLIGILERERASPGETGDTSEQSAYSKIDILGELTIEPQQWTKFEQIGRCLNGILQFIGRVRRVQL